ncbi:MAG: hypothetical protein GXY43_03560 [Clostridiaceae bacterium]|nr:hypothetical protein [Clostridiaceae bacterium]
MSNEASTEAIKNSPPVFCGEVKKIKIVSDYRGFDPPLPGNEIEQRLTITADGRVFFSSFTYYDDKFVKKRVRRFKTDSMFAETVLRCIGKIFRDDFVAPVSPDKGGWKLFITNTDNLTFTFSGYLCLLVDELEYLSSVIREELRMPELLVFDGQAHEDRIEKVIIDYQRITQQEPGKSTINPADDYLTASCSERIILDRAAETLVYFQKIGSVCQVSRTYHANRVMSAFLDAHYSVDLFSSIQGDPPDVASDSNDSKDFTITVEYLYGKPRVISGTFDKNGLPEDFPIWAEDIQDIMDYCGRGEIVRPSIYGKVKRRSGDHIFCSVVFGGGKSYYYRTEDDTLQIGDSVLVPVRSAGETAVAEIIKIEYFAEEDAPLPLERIKIIIRRCTDEDFASLQENERAAQDSSERESTESIEVDRPTQNILKPDSSDPIIEEQPDNEGHAQPFDRLVLCDEKTPYVQVFVSAEMSEGCLKISGQDLGEAPRETFGEDEYEYFYDFDLENTERLFALLTPEKQSIAGVLVREFSGMDGCSKLREFCDENHIEYSFFTC